MILQKLLQIGVIGLCLTLPLSIAAMNIFLGVLSILLALQALFKKRLEWEKIKMPLFYALIAYLSAAAFSTTHGVNPSHSTQYFLKDCHKLWIFILFILLLHIQDFSKSIIVLLSGFVIHAVFALSQFRMTDSWAWERIHGLVHPVSYGLITCIGILGFLSFRKISFLGLSDTLWKKLRIIAIFLLTLSLILNQTRIALIGFIVGYVTLWALRPHQKMRLVLAVAAVLSVTAIWEVMPTGGRNLRELFTSNEVWINPSEVNPHLARLALWEIAVNAFKDHPFTGVGPGNYSVVFSRYFSGSINGQQLWGSAHNLYLHQLAERGLLGELALLLFLGLMTWRALQRAQIKPQPMQLWSAASSTSFLAMNITEVAFQVEQIAALMLFIWCWAEVSFQQESLTNKENIQHV